MIHKDYTRKIRTKRSYLMAIRAELEKVTGRRRMPLIFDHLMVDNLRLTWEAGKMIAGREDGRGALQRLLGVDLAPFIDDLVNNGLPRRHRVTGNNDHEGTSSTARGEDLHRGPILGLNLQRPPTPRLEGAAPHPSKRNIGRKIV